ncbi:MAG: hypothetical protein J6Q89_06345 [Clostridia bacterium]|nr:hypothetical protein [Clostridia bacterium]
MQEIVQLIMNNGIGVVLLGYFIYKDSKWNASITSVLGEIKEVLVELRTYHAKDKE